jgi:hypothetical protein
VPLTALELHCVQLACDFLSRVREGRWALVDGLTPDEQDPSAPTPEAVVSDGNLRAAVEVKRLKGPTGWQRHLSAQRWLEQYLAPTCGGRYHLVPPDGIYLPIDRKLARELKRQIEQVAPTMAVGETRPVPVPREGVLQFIAGSQFDHIYCSHNARVFGAFSRRIPGTYWLVDDDEPEHSFVTDRGMQAFWTALEVASRQARAAGQATMYWQEEWPLTLLNVEGRGVEVRLIFGAADLPASVSENVETMVAKALPKFTGQRWGDLSVLVFEKSDPIISADRVRCALGSLDRQRRIPFDLVLLVDDEVVSQVWPPRA